MKGILLFTVFSISCLMFFGCRDNALKEPVDVQFLFEIEPSDDEELSFRKADFRLTSFRFDGMRQAGDDVYFQINYPEGLEINLFDSDILDEFQFDIPQGIYDDIEITFELMASETQSSFSSEGTVIIENGEEELNFFYEEDASFSIDMHAVAANGSSQIILDKSTTNEARILVDLDELFSTITPANWNNVDSNNGEVLISSESGPPNLYSKLNSEMPKIFSLVIY